MALLEIDKKYLGRFAIKFQDEHPLLAQNLHQILGILTMLSGYVTRARKLRRSEETPNTSSKELYSRIIWCSREGLKLVEEYVLPMVVNFGELLTLSCKLRASFYYLYVLFHNCPPISLRMSRSMTSPGASTLDPRLREVTGEDQESVKEILPSDSIQSTNLLRRESGAGSENLSGQPQDLGADFLIPAKDYRLVALTYFQNAALLASNHLSGSHPIRLSTMAEYSTYMYECLHDCEESRNLAKRTVSEAFNSPEGIDDERFQDAAELVNILRKIIKLESKEDDSMNMQSPEV